MRRRRSQRGAGLLWAVAAITFVLLAISIVAGALAGQAGGLRRMKTEAARQDLERAGRLWAGDLARRGELEPGRSLELVGGRVEIASEGSPRELLLHVAGEAAPTRVALTQ